MRSDHSRLGGDHARGQQPGALRSGAGADPRRGEFARTGLRSSGGNPVLRRSIVIRSLARMNNHVRFLQVTNKIVPPDIASATLGAHETASFACVFQFVVLVPAATPDNAEWSA